MQKSANEQSVTAQKGRSIHFCVANAESHQQLLQVATYFKVKSILEKNSTNQLAPYEQALC